MYPEHTPSWMTDDLLMFRDAVRRFVEQELVPTEDRWIEERRMDRAMWGKAGQAGLLCASIAEEYGGGGGSFAHDAVITHELARAGINSFGNNVHSGIVAHYLARYGSEEQKRRWLPRMATGELIAAIAMSEPGAGSDLRAIRTRAVRDGDHYVIDGAKTFITNGINANLIVVVAKTGDEGNKKNISLIVIETEGLAGFERGRNLEKIGQKGQDTAELFFSSMRVPCANLLGPEEGQGMFQLVQQLAQERLIVAIISAAAMQRAVDLTVEYANTRQVFGQRLLDLQNTRFKLAECKTYAALATSFVDDCMERALAGTLDIETAAMAKWWCSQHYCTVVDECLQLFGGYGYMTEYPIAKMYANARVTRIYGGSNEVLKELIARRLDPQPLSRAGR
ncbi:acyl-CoA dehydrogenase family protein [uncultured Hydrogenophaga sp.]|uniref:acyl-CoA dehydrogenase family protein n=1 Tax=uncultured Hydrogenophaga sp. TaxID=199683 RepID=UPI00258C9D6A|nr:acyl-CoA dehydrogenase family protein [uncultured Hydrogenophaga sp.]